MAAARDHAFLLRTLALFYLVYVWHLFVVGTVAQAFNQTKSGAESSSTSSSSCSISPANNTSYSTSTSSSTGTSTGSSDSSGAHSFSNSSSTCNSPSTLNQSGAAGNQSGAAGNFGSGAQRKKPIILLIIIVISSASAISIIAICLVYARRRRRVDDIEMQRISPLLPRRFSYKHLCSATNNFNKFLGAGAFGSVYEGFLPDTGEKVAVKILTSVKKGQAGQFLAEILSIGRTSHVNVVSLIGVCCEPPHYLLVYEYVERGSLDKWLFGKEAGASAAGTDASSAMTAPAPLLDWQTRYRVALGIARGLAYLHEECSKHSIWHLDIKPQNILLDNDFTPKLADFGMSQLAMRGISLAKTLEVKGTLTYIAPECSSRKVIGEKFDIFSMGMVMLEIVSGRTNAELTLSPSALKQSTQTPEAWHFFSWVLTNCEEGGDSSKLLELVDESLRACSECDMEQVQRLIYTALWCVQGNAALRPSASEVVQWLEGRSRVKRPPATTFRAP